MTAGALLISRCESCHSRFLPRPGGCPRCGSQQVEPQELPPRGVVLAATELLAPAPGWPAPHRLALVELAEAVRLLALVSGELPARGDVVTVVRDGDRYLTVAPAPSE